MSSHKDDSGYQIQNNAIYPLLQAQMASGVINLSASINISGNLRAALVDGNYSPKMGNRTFMTNPSTTTGSIEYSWVGADVAITGGILVDMCTGSWNGWNWQNRCPSGWGSPYVSANQQHISSSDGNTIFPLVTHGSNLTHLVFYLDSGSNPGTDYLVGIFNQDKNYDNIDITTDGGDITFNWQASQGIFRWDG